MSAERVSVFINAATGGAVNPAKSSVLAFEKEISAKLDGELEVIRQCLLSSPVINTDETPIKSTERLITGDDVVIEVAKGTTYQLCVRTYSCANAALLTVNSHKNIEGVKNDALLPSYTGTQVHDHDTKYYNFGTGRHAECNTHIERYLKDILELTKHSWTQLMAQLLIDMLVHKRNDIANNITVMDAAYLQKYDAEFDRIIALGKEENATLNPDGAICKDERRLLTRLDKYKENHLLFAYDYTVPFSNNCAEKDLRWIKTQQKVSGCHRSYNGAVVRMRIMSFITTLKKRKMDVMQALDDILHNKSVLT